jgi:hypothetical protein
VLRRDGEFVKVVYKIPGARVAASAKAKKTGFSAGAERGTFGLEQFRGKDDAAAGDVGE